jgi:hypothetical protein
MIDEERFHILNEVKDPSFRPKGSFAFGSGMAETAIVQDH